MKKFFLLILFLLVTIILTIIFNKDHIRDSNFIGKESIKKSFFYVKKKTIQSKYKSCFIDKKNKGIDKQIIIAGHTYGTPGDKNLSTYPKFLNHLKKKLHKYDHAFLAGDIAFEGNKENFLRVKNELSFFFNNLYVAPGNHDVGLLSKDKNIIKEFLSVFNKNYQKVIINKNLFITLDSTINPGNISTNQIIYLKEKIKNIKDIKNIFIITHHPVWQNYTNKKVLSNEWRDLPLNNNFNDVLSLFKNLKKEVKVFFVAGDFGVFHHRTVLFCEKNKNFYFIATGMGNKKLDNYLKVLISADGEIVSINPIFF